VVFSIFTYDLYQTYIQPKASGKQLIYMSHSMVIGFAIAMAAWSTALHYIGISMGYLYLLMGVIVSAAVLPATLTLMWSGQNWAAATFSPILGFACALIAWLVTAKKQGGTLNVATTGANNPMLAGNVVALLSPLIFVPVLTFACGGLQHYDWLSMKAIRKADDHDLAADANVDLELLPGERSNSVAEEEAEQEKLLKASKIARYMTVGMTLALLVLWPMPMYGSGYVFSKKFFTGWVVVGILWMFISTFCVGLYPLWEGRKTSMGTLKSIYLDITGKKKFGKGAGVVHGEAAIVEETSGTGTPTEKVLPEKQ
jgi:hypothetical protein